MNYKHKKLHQFLSRKTYVSKLNFLNVKLSIQIRANEFVIKIFKNFALHKLQLNCRSKFLVYAFSVPTDLATINVQSSYLLT